MDHVTRAGGHILSVDLKLSPSANLHAFSRRDVLSYFPDAEIEYAQPVHLRSFRRLYGRHVWLASALSRMTDRGCESWFLLLAMAGSV